MEGPAPVWRSAWSVTRILSQRYPMPPFIPTAALKRGADVHAWCQAWDDGQAPIPPEEIRGWCEGWKRFDQAFTPSWDFVEYAVECDDYHGFLDRAGSLRGRPNVLEIKTGRPRAEGVDGLQLAAYAKALHPTTYDTVQRLGVYLTEAGKYTVRVYADPNDFLLWAKLVQEVINGNHSTPSR